MKRIYSRGYKHQKISQLAMPNYGQMGNDLDLFYDSALGADTPWPVIRINKGNIDSQTVHRDKWDYDSDSHITEQTNNENMSSGFSVMYQADVFYSDKLKNIYGPVGTAFENLLNQTPEVMRENPVIEEEIRNNIQSGIVDSSSSYTPEVINISPIGNDMYRITFNINVNSNSTFSFNDELG